MSENWTGVGGSACRMSCSLAIRGPHQFLASCLQEASLSCHVKLLKGLLDCLNDTQQTSLNLLGSLSPSPRMWASLGFIFPALCNY